MKFSLHDLAAKASVLSLLVLQGAQRADGHCTFYDPQHLQLAQSNYLTRRLPYFRREWCLLKLVGIRAVGCSLSSSCSSSALELSRYVSILTFIIHSSIPHGA